MESFLWNNSVQASTKARLIHIFCLWSSCIYASAHLYVFLFGTLLNTRVLVNITWGRHHDCPCNMDSNCPPCAYGYWGTCNFRRRKKGCGLWMITSGILRVPWAIKRKRGYWIFCSWFPWLFLNCSWYFTLKFQIRLADVVSMREKWDLQCYCRPLHSSEVVNSSYYPHQN